jgi:hypothetical protein
MNRGTFIEKLTEVQQTIAQLVAQLQSSEHDQFAAHVYQSRREFGMFRTAQTRVTRQLSAASSQATKSHKAGDLEVTSVLANTCFEFTSDAKILARELFIDCNGGSNYTSSDLYKIAEAFGKCGSVVKQLLQDR